MACFADINVSQGSVATYARCGGIFNIRLTANLLRNFPVIFLKSVKIWQNYGHESVAPLSRPTLHMMDVVRRYTGRVGVWSRSWAGHGHLSPDDPAADHSPVSFHSSLYRGFLPSSL